MKTTVLTIAALVTLVYAASAQNEWGPGAGSSTATSSNNAAFGYDALHSLTSGNACTAFGYQALLYDTDGGWNTANGTQALYSNADGIWNTATGVQALFSNNGNYNTANGANALWFNTTGSYNTADGGWALFDNTTGSGNIALGWYGGINVTTGDNNIDIGNAGVVGESAAIRIGTAGTQTSTFIAGISGTTVAGGSVVVVSSDGQLGTASAGSAVPQGAYLALPTNAVAPVGYTLLGTTSMKCKYQVEGKYKNKTITLDLYQKD
jgi:hypothetical protein